jgi:hypothetical protein
MRCRHGGAAAQVIRITWLSWVVLSPVDFRRSYCRGSALLARIRAVTAPCHCSRGSSAVSSTTLPFLKTIRFPSSGSCGPVVSSCIAASASAEFSSPAAPRKCRYDEGEGGGGPCTASVRAAARGVVSAFMVGASNRNIGGSSRARRAGQRLFSGTVRRIGGTNPDQDAKGFPAFNLDDDALDVFSMACFLPDEDMERKREKALRGKSVRAVLRRFIKENRKEDMYEALGSLSAAIGVDRELVEGYCAKADMSARLWFAATLFEDRYLCEFQEATITIGSALDPLLLDGPPAEADGALRMGARTLDLSLLAPLRLAENDRFLAPHSLFFRDGMRTIFDLFRDDVESNMEPGSRSAVLIGSPGVGTSILAFLAALFQAQRRMVVYYRITESRGEQPCVFVMAPAGNGECGGVHVWFSRTLDMRSFEACGGLQSLSLSLDECLRVRRDAYYAYVDGPKYDDRVNTMSGTYDYFCTSGGFGGYKSEEFGKRLWILSGWTREEAMAGLAALGVKQTIAEQAYEICGGSIREMLKACDSPSISKQALDGLLDRISLESMKLAATSTLRDANPGSSDRLRTMFERRLESSGDAWRGIMLAYQVVDSPYLLDRLCDMVGAGPFLEAFQLSLSRGLTSSRGVFFKYLVHERIRKIMNHIHSIHDVCWSEGSRADGLRMLNETNLYWKPSISNFKAVDAALIDKGTLYVFQMTTQDTKQYNATSLEIEFASVVRQKVAFDRTVVCFVIPKGTNFQLPARQFETDPVYRADEIDMTNLDSIDESLVQLFCRLRKVYP